MSKVITRTIIYTLYEYDQITIRIPIMINSNKEEQRTSGWFLTLLSFFNK